MRILKEFLKRFRENKLRSWATFGYIAFAYSCLRLTNRYTLDDIGLFLPKGLNWLSTPGVSIKFWGILWGIAAILGICGGIQNFWNNEKNKILFTSILCFIALHIIWAASYLTGWLFYQGQTEWFNAFGYIGFTGLLLGYASGTLGAIRGKKPFNNNIEDK